MTATWHTCPNPDPASGILVIASDLPGSVVVMASHGRTDLHRLALGSVTLDVLAHSPQSVLVGPTATPVDGQAE